MSEATWLPMHPGGRRFSAFPHAALTTSVPLNPRVAVEDIPMRSARCSSWIPVAMMMAVVRVAPAAAQPAPAAGAGAPASVPAVTEVRTQLATSINTLGAPAHAGHKHGGQ